MDYTKTGSDLTVRLIRDFNLLTARRLAPMTEDVTSVRIDLTNAKIVDSEAVRLLHTMIRSGKRVTLIHPPRILTEVIDILGLDGILDITAMTESDAPPTHLPPSGRKSDE